jgi:MFS family permease
VVNRDCNSETQQRSFKETHNKPLENRGSIMGLYSVFLGVGQFLGTSIGGYFAEWNGVDGLLMLSAIFGTITAVSLLTLRRREPPASAAPINLTVEESI